MTESRSVRFAIWIALMCMAGIGACSGDSDPVDTGSASKWPPPDPLTIAPPGFPAMVIPGKNPITVQGVALGRRLYYDPILSGDSTQACASCHHFGRAFTDTLRFSVGIRGIEGLRNAPHLTNAAWLSAAFWDGRAASLEEQALGPVANPIEMNEPWDNVEKKLQRHPDYPELFGRAFGTDNITRDRAVKAIAQFERTFVSNHSKFDIWLATRDAQAAGFTPAQERGRQIFDSERGDCFHCHPINIFLTDGAFHNIGLDSPFVDLGLADITGDPNDLGKFKVPSLRNVELTAPYMHDGRFAKLKDVVEHYNGGGFSTSTIDPLLRKRGVGLGLSAQEVGDVVEFLKTFTDTAFVNNPSLREPPE